jgi:hypothetical protein
MKSLFIRRVSDILIVTFLKGCYSVLRAGAASNMSAVEFWQSPCLHIAIARRALGTNSMPVPGKMKSSGRLRFSCYGSLHGGAGAMRSFRTFQTPSPQPSDLIVTRARGRSSRRAAGSSRDVPPTPGWIGLLDCPEYHAFIVTKSAAFKTWMPQ